MLKTSFFTFLFVLVSLFAYSQESAIKKTVKTKKGTFYLALGSNRVWYTPSDIYVKRKSAPFFSFTLYDVEGKDEGGLIFDTAPQFTYTVGYYFNKLKFGVEYHYDHTKYFVTPNQVVRLSGSINGFGQFKDTALTPDFFKLEHSDGANFAMVNLVKWIPITNQQKFFYTEWLVKAGLGIVNPKTNSTILGQHRDDKYHLSGFITGLETGLRIHAGRTFFATTSFKGAYASYSQFLIDGGYGKQKWFSGQFNYLVGAQFPL